MPDYIEVIDGVVEINYIEDLVDLSNSVKWGMNFENITVKLTRTLDFNDEDSYRDFSDTSYGDINADGIINNLKTELTSGNGFSPIGDRNLTAFTGMFDGQGYEIKNLYINKSLYYYGFFGIIKNAEIKNLGISGNVTQNSTQSENQYIYSNCGMLVGVAFNSRIDNCHTEGSVYGKSVSTGGIAGMIMHNSFMTNCYNSAYVNGTGINTGGVIGVIQNSNVSLCYNVGNIEAYDRAGGICGIFGTGTYMYETSVLENCYNIGNISSSGASTASAGGISGYLSSRYNKLRNCYNIGNISSSNRSGRITGTLDSNAQLTNCYYLNTISVLGSCNSYGIAKAENDMKLNSFVDLLGNKYWMLDEISLNNGFPIFKNYQNLIENNECIKINYIEDLVVLSNSVNYAGNDYKGKIIELERDLDFNDENSYRDYANNSYGDINGDGTINEIKTELTSGNGFMPIGINENNSFSGIFDGKGFEIKNLYEDKSSNYQGLFGYIVNAEIKNLGINGVLTINGNMYCGEVAGYAKKSTIFNCHNTGTIINSGTSGYIGGIVGYTDESNINNCYNLGNIDSKVSYLGGISGYLSNGSIINCYNVAEMKGQSTSSNYVGGIVGYVNDKGEITECYNNGFVKSIGNVSYSGGIVGGFNSSNILSNCYNTAEISANNTVNNGTSISGGIVGYIYSANNYISNCYNVGNINSNSAKGYVGEIIGLMNNDNNNLNNCYYLNTSIMVGNKENEIGIKKYLSEMVSKEFYDSLNVDKVWQYNLGDYPTLRYMDVYMAQTEEVTELVISNTIKKFVITVENQNENGGVIEANSEIVKYGENSQNAIRFIPNEGYEINKITINGKSLLFESDIDGSYTIPEGFFSNVVEDKNIVVIFVAKDSIFTINKVDENNNNLKLQGAKYEITDNDNYREEYVTDERGQIKACVPGESVLYVTELEAPEGYTKNSNTITYTMIPGQNNEITLTNKEQTQITVHHYYKDTTNKVAEDDIYKGDIGSEYVTTPKIDLDYLCLTKDENNNYIIPEYAVGVYDDNVEISYYYELEPINLTIHHLKYEGNEQLSDDEIITNICNIEFEEDSNYKVLPLRYELKDNEKYNILNENYNLLEISSEITSDITIDDTLEYYNDLEIIYMYTPKQYKYTINYYYDSIKDESITVQKDAYYLDEISTYMEGIKPGYEFDKVEAFNQNGEIENLPLVIGCNESNNIINVYYKSVATVQYTIQNNWNIQNLEDIQKYKSTFILYKNSLSESREIVEDIYEKISIKIYDDNGISEYKLSEIDEQEVKVSVIGNGKVIFENLPKYENELEVIYSVEEVKIEKLDSMGQNWIDCSLNRFSITHMESNVVNDLINNTHVYDITTKIEKNTNGSGTGTITGVYNDNYSEEQNIKYVESIIEGDEATRDIEVIPDIGFDIISIMINGVDYDFEPDSNGKVIIPSSYFINVTKDYCISVRFGNPSKTIKIIKTDEDGNRLEGARFSVSGEGSSEIVDFTEYMSSIMPYSTYYFEEQSDGTYLSNNQGCDDTTAVSYMTVDLSDIQGEYAIIVNGKVSSESGYDFGYIIVSDYDCGEDPGYGDGTMIPMASDFAQAGEVISGSKYIMQNSGELDSQDYIALLEGGNLYYIYFAYGKDGSAESGDDAFVINSVRMSSQVTVLTDDIERYDDNSDYYFENQGYGTYESNNAWCDASAAVSYMNIDLSNEAGIYNLSVNAKVSSYEDHDYGYIIISENDSYQLTTGNIIDDISSIENGNVEIEPGVWYLMADSGYVESRTYSAELQGGNNYTIYFVYEKDGYSSDYDDRFIINSVILENTEECGGYAVVTNENGEVFLEIDNYGTYNIREIKAPKHFIKSNLIKEIEIDSASNSPSVTFVNEYIKHIITTEIGETASGVRIGGTITGEINTLYTEDENKKLVELVNEGKNATKDIEIVPADGYYVLSISINGRKYQFTPDDDGKVIIPKSTFENVEKDYNVLVVFGENEKTIKINKVDENNNPVEGAKFRLTSTFNRKNVELNLNSLISDMQESEEDSSYSFDYNEETGAYTSNNLREDGTYAVGYKTIDLSQLSGSYKFKVNAAISSESGCDYGYVVIQESEDLIPVSYIMDEYYNMYELLNISGNESSYDYETYLDGGKKYIVYFVYYKDSSVSNGTDTFTINSVLLDCDSAPVIVETELTDSNGEVSVSLRGYGTYTIKEIVTPEHFVTMSDQEFELLSSDDNQIVTVENIHKPTVVTHHYYKDENGEYTTNKVAEDVVTEGNIGANYTTSSKTNLNGLQQEKVNGAVVTPQYATGTYVNGVREVNYYYELIPVTLTMHHYKENTIEELTTDDEISLVPEISFPEDGTYTITSEFEYDLSENNKYKEAITTNRFVKVVNNTADNTELNIEDNLAYTTNTEITYFYGELTEYNYTIHYREQDVDGDEGILADDKEETEIAIEESVSESPIDIIGYNPVDTSEVIISSDYKEHTFYYTKRNDLTYTINYINKVTNETAKEAKVVTTGTFKDVITAENEAIEIPGFEYVSADKESITIGVDSTQNVMTLYYVPAYSITTSANEHTELYRDGTIGSIVTGGTISGQTDEVYENVLSGEDATKNIVITPDEGYQIYRVTITVGDESKDLDIESHLDDNGRTVTIKPEEETSLQEVTSNISIEAEFRKKSKVTVRYIDKGTNQPIADEVEIDGLESVEFTPSLPSVPGYRRTRVSMGSATEEAPVYLTEENGEPKYTEMTDANNKMSADPSILIYWYEPIPEGTVLVRHIEVDEQDINGTYNLESGTEIAVEEIASLEEYQGQVGTTKETSRKEFTDTETGRRYISVDGPENNNENIVVMDKDTDEYTITIEERDLDNDGIMDIQEIRYYYERQYEITVKDISNEGMVSGLDVTTDGGRYGIISGDGENAYEIVNRMGSNTKKIEAVPNENYIVKVVKVNGLAIDITDITDENGKVTIPAGYFTEIVEDKMVEVVFEKAPAKVIVRYVDEDTDEELERSTIVGKVDDTYTAEPKEIDGYEVDTSKLPSNNEIVMTKEDTEIIYYYKKIVVPPEEPDEPEVPEEPDEPEKTIVLEEIHENGGEAEEIETEEKEPTITIEYHNNGSRISGKTYRNPKTGDNISQKVINFVISVFAIFGIEIKKFSSRKIKNNKDNNDKTE